MSVIHVPPGVPVLAMDVHKSTISAGVLAADATTPVVDKIASDDEAVRLANATDYGLGAYVHTQNLRRAHYVTSQLDAGMIHVNGSGEAMQPNAPFGGYKNSGHGRLGGVEGLHEFLQPKNIWMNLAQ